VFSLPHLRTETGPVSERSCFLVPRVPDDGKSKNPSNSEGDTPLSEPFWICLQLWESFVVSLVKPISSSGPHSRLSIQRISAVSHGSRNLTTFFHLILRWRFRWYASTRFSHCCTAWCIGILPNLRHIWWSTSFIRNVWPLSPCFWKANCWIHGGEGDRGVLHSLRD
jgi:hypothetical protein